MKHWRIITGGLLFIAAQAAPSCLIIHDGSLADANIHYVGRWDRSDPGVFHSYWGGAYLRVRFTGTSVGIRLADGTDLAVSIDGEPPREVGAGRGVTALNVRPVTPGTHTLLVGSAGQNYEVAFQGLTLDPGAVTEPVPARPLIEFVGDSITTGGGPKFLVFVNYAWETAEALGCDHTQISFSARALTSGYGCAGDKAGLDVLYFRMKGFNHLYGPPVPWNFSYAPQIVVINLGQNDQCGNEPSAVLTVSYENFVRAIRSKFPQAQIVALRPFGGAYAEAERKAVEALIAGGDTRVRFIDTDVWLEKSDFADGVHPNASGHAKVARRLAPLLRPLEMPSRAIRKENQ